MKGRSVKLLSLSMVFVTIIMLAIGNLSVIADTPPAPHNFYGSLTIGGSPAPVGTGIQGWIGGVNKTCPPYDTATEGVYGSETFSGKFQVCGESGDIDATVIFFVETSPDVYTQADQTGVFASDGNTNLNLTVGVSCTPTGKSETTCDGVDDDCDYLIDEDYVSDTSCFLPGVCAAGNVASSCTGGVETACATGSPTGADNDCNNIDEDCSGTADDNYVPDSSCFLPGVCAAGNIASSCTGGVETACATGSPTGADNDCNNVDEDCSGVADDNYVSDTSCFLPGACSAFNVGSTCIGGVETACQTGTPVAEVCTGGVDDDCDGAVDCADSDCIGDPACEGIECVDSDGDGYDAYDAVTCPTGNDCNDANVAVNPGATEVKCDGIDNDCSGGDDGGTDLDQDTYKIDGDLCGLIDCNDADAGVNPGASEVCTGGVDDDCDGDVDCADSDCAQDESCAQEYCLTILGMRLLYQNGSEILSNTVSPGQQFQIEVRTENSCEDPIEALRIIQVLAPQSMPMYLGTVTNPPIPGLSISTMTLGWTMDPEAVPGTYTAEAYNWDQWCSQLGGCTILSIDGSMTFTVT